MLKAILKPILKFVALILYRVKKVGEENVPKEGAFILCGNHVQALDAPVVIVCTKRDINFMAKEELFKNKFFKWIAGVFGAFPVKRNYQDIDSVKKSLKILKSNGALGIFPEGTRKGMAKNAKIKNGAAFIALRTGVPVIPLGIQGTFKPFSKVKLNYGKPLTFEEYVRKKPEKEHLEIVSKEIMDNIIMLTNEKI